MTGFGAAERQRDTGSGTLTARAELRTVNHRHLLVKLRLPAEVAGLEAKVEGLVRERLTRGTLNGALVIERSGGEAQAGFDVELAKAYAAGAADLAIASGVEGPLTLDGLLRLPGVVAGRQVEGSEAELPDLVLEVIGAALDELSGMREHEGAAMVADLRQNADVVAGQVQSISERMPVAVAEHQAKLQERVAVLLGEAHQVSPTDLAREVAVLADRMDVAEEVSRLRAHLDQLEGLLSAGGAVGRKLDFLVQEFLREANTIGSKCSDAQVAHHVVELKAHIERLREQVQNIE